MSSWSTLRELELCRETSGGVDGRFGQPFRFCWKIKMSIFLFCDIVEECSEWRDNMSRSQPKQKVTNLAAQVHKELTVHYRSSDF